MSEDNVNYREILREIEQEQKGNKGVKAVRLAAERFAEPLSQELIDISNRILSSEGIDGFEWENEEVKESTRPEVYSVRHSFNVTNETELDNGMFDKGEIWIGVRGIITVSVAQIPSVSRRKETGLAWELVPQVSMLLDWNGMLLHPKEIDRVHYATKGIPSLILDNDERIEADIRRARRIIVDGIARKVNMLTHMGDEREAFVEEVIDELGDDWDVIKRERYEVALEYLGDTGDAARHGVVFYTMPQFHSVNLRAGVTDPDEFSNLRVERYARPIHPRQFDDDLKGFCSGGYGTAAAEVLTKGRDEIQNAAMLCRFSAAQLAGARWADPTYERRRRAELKRREEENRRAREMRERRREEMERRARERMDNLADSLNVTVDKLNEMLGVLAESEAAAERIGRELWEAENER